MNLITQPRTLIDIFLYVHKKTITISYYSSKITKKQFYVLERSCWRPKSELMKNERWRKFWEYLVFAAPSGRETHNIKCEKKRLAGFLFLFMFFIDYNAVRFETNYRKQQLYKINDFRKNWHQVTPYLLWTNTALSSQGVLAHCQMTQTILSLLYVWENTFSTAHEKWRHYVYK